MLRATSQLNYIVAIFNVLRKAPEGADITERHLQLLLRMLLPATLLPRRVFTSQAQNSESRLSSFFSRLDEIVLSIRLREKQRVLSLTCKIAASVLADTPELQDGMEERIHQQLLVRGGSSSVSLWDICCSSIGHQLRNDWPEDQDLGICFALGLPRGPEDFRSLLDRVWEDSDFQAIRQRRLLNDLARNRANWAFYFQCFGKTKDVTNLVLILVSSQEAQIEVFSTEFFEPVFMSMDDEDLRFCRSTLSRLEWQNPYIPVDIRLAARADTIGETLAKVVNRQVDSSSSSSLDASAVLDVEDKRIGSRRSLRQASLSNMKVDKVCTVRG